MSGRRTEDHAGLLVREDDPGQVAFDGSLSFGRHPDNDVVLDHPRISGRHAALECRGGGWRLVDLGSRNGTSVNKRRLSQPRAIRVGDVLRFAGVSRWRVERLGTPPSGVGLRSTEVITASDARDDVHLTLRYEGADEGTLTVRQADLEWSVTTGQRFFLLLLLARRPGEWIDDHDLKRGRFAGLGLHGARPPAPPARDFARSVLVGPPPPTHLPPDRRRHRHRPQLLPRRPRRLWRPQRPPLGPRRRRHPPVVGPRGRGRRRRGRPRRQRAVGESPGRCRRAPTPTNSAATSLAPVEPARRLSRPRTAGR